MNSADLEWMLKKSSVGVPLPTFICAYGGEAVGAGPT